MSSYSLPGGHAGRGDFNGMSMQDMRFKILDTGILDQ